MTIDWIPFLHTIASEADNIAMQYYQSAQLKTDVKKDMTPVSEADLAIENHIRKLVAEQHPELSIIGEEYGETITDSNIKLIIDPIDGTKNFIAGIPFFSTLLAIEADGIVIAGMMSAPAAGDKLWAQQGQGAFHNGKQVHVSKQTDLKKSLAMHCSIYGPEAPHDPTKLLNLLSKTFRQRGFADYLSPVYVANGAGEFCVDFNIQPWDMAAVKIIIEEAGGKFTDIYGKETIYSGNYVASNGLLHDEILSYFR